MKLHICTRKSSFKLSPTRDFDHIKNFSEVRQSITLISLLLTHDHYNEHRVKVEKKKRSRLNPTERGRGSLNGSLFRLFRQNANDVVLKSRLVGLPEYFLKGFFSHNSEATKNAA